MASPPLMFAAERSWTEDKERALIAFFSDHSCLWNHKSESYKNRQLRWKTLEHLRIQLSSHPPPVPFTVEDIKSKFKNLRTTFQRQFKMVKASKEVNSEEEFVPQWKYYQQLMFLQSCWDQDHNPEQPPLSPPSGPPEVSQLLLSSPPSASSPAATTSSSCLPSMIKCYWTEEQESALISFYSEHDCLWNKKSENHNNRQLRLRLLETLRSQLSDYNVSFSVEDVKCKFKNLRTVFNREYKTIQASRTSDKIYMSKWKHFQQLLFLSESCDEDDADELHILMSYQDKTGDQGIQTSSNPSIIHGSCQTDLKPSSGFQTFLSTSPDHLKADASSLPPSPSSSRPEANSSPLNFSAPCLAQTDRPSAETRCLWSEVKVQQLITFYSAHSGLWDHRSESYRNRQVRQSLLETLSSLLSENEPVTFTVDDIKTKFRNLRTIFQREHKVVRANRTCGSEDFYLPKWKHYQQLMFLCDSCDEDEQTEEPARLRLDRQASVMQPHQSPHSNTTSDSRNSSPSVSPSPSTSSSHLTGHKRTSQDVALASGEIVDLLRTLCQHQPISPHAGFLKYVEECLNETPPNKVRILKKRIVETIHSLSEDG